jgi:hypothetical protein
MIPFALLERPVEPPLLLLARREGVVVMVADPVVLRIIDAEVEVIDETTPSEVVTMTVTICCVDVDTRAEVMVVFEVLALLSDDLLVFDLVAVSEVGVTLVDGVTADVVSEVTVDLEVTVVGVLLVVVVDTDVMTLEVVIVVLDVVAAFAEVVVVVAAAAVEPVPAACRLWNTPSAMGLPSAADADAVATRARRESASRAEKYIVAQRHETSEDVMWSKRLRLPLGLRRRGTVGRREWKGKG